MGLPEHIKAFLILPGYAWIRIVIRLFQIRAKNWEVELGMMRKEWGIRREVERGLWPEDFGKRTLA